MILLGDIGNTRQKWALLDGEGRLLPLVDCARQARSCLTTALTAGGIANLSRVVVASVAGEAANAVVVQELEALGVPSPEWLHTPAEACGIRVGYRDPSRFGVDRFLALVGARARVPGGFVVVDAGTAVTFDLVNGDGGHQGGSIIPGLGLMREALTAGTARAHADTGISSSVLATETGDAIAAGTIFGLAGAIDRICDEMAARCDGEPTLLLTGGDARALEPFLKRRYHYEPELVFEGMAIYATR